jgi:hypothetical protein
VKKVDFQHKAGVQRLPGPRRTLNLTVMSTVKEIESAVSQLSPEELSAFRTWFSEFDAAVWDKQFEQDVKAGRLDKLADEALKDLRN